MEAVRPDAAHRVQEMREAMRADHESKIKTLLEQRGYAGAAALEKQFDELTAEVEALLIIPDLVGAAKRLEEARGMPSRLPPQLEAWRKSFEGRMVAKGNQARAAATAARAAAIEADILRGKAPGPRIRDSTAPGKA